MTAAAITAAAMTTTTVKSRIIVSMIRGESSDGTKERERGRKSGAARRRWSTAVVVVDQGAQCKNKAMISGRYVVSM